MNILISSGQSYGDSSKPLDIDENEELERILALKHRETLIRGMGKRFDEENASLEFVSCCLRHH